MPNLTEPVSSIKVINIEVTDLSPGKGAFSDLALFLKPLPIRDRGLFFNSESHAFNPNPKGGTDFSYEYEMRTLKNENKLDFDLKEVIGIKYNYDSYIIQDYILKIAENKEESDSLYNEGGTEKLWYEAGSDRLNRENLRSLLDRLPNLFIHQYFFLLPICLGDVANAQGLYEEALNWYRIVYDEREDDINKQPYPFLNKDIEVPMMRQRIAKNFIDWADYLFQLNTQESLQAGRRKYKRVLELLDSKNCCGLLVQVETKSVLDKIAETAYKIIGDLPIEYNRFIFYEHVIKVLLNYSTLMQNQTSFIQLAKDVGSIIGKPISSETKINEVQARLDKAEQELLRPIQLQEMLLDRNELKQKLIDLEGKYPDVLNRFEQAIVFETLILPASEPVDLPGSIPLLEPDFQPLLLEDTRPEIADSALAVTPVSESLALTSAIDTLEFLSERNLMLRPGISLPRTLPFYELESRLIDQTDDFILISAPGSDVIIKPHIVRDTFLDYITTNDEIMKAKFCDLPNPYSQAFIQRACRGIHLIDHCFNVLGLPNSSVSIYRFEYLLSLAKNFANLALSAEKDFMQFKEKFESDTLEIMNANQAVTRAQANVQLADLQLQEAVNQITAAYQQIAGVNNQIQLVQNRLAEVGSGWSVFGIVLGAVVTAVSSAITAGGASGVAVGIYAGLIAGATTAAGGGGAYAAGIEETEEGLRQQLQRLQTVDYPAARLNLSNAIDHHRSVQQQVHIARLEAEFVAERATFLTYQFFNPQLWSFLAREIKKYYRTYVQYGTIAAWLAQRSLQFELGIDSKRRFAQSWPITDRRDASLDIIRFDYFQAPQQGLLAADSLIRDIATLEQEKFLSDQRKLKITKVISLAQTRPLEYAHFLNNGQLYFGTSLMEFDLDYPGHYQRRIKEVRVNVFGLIGQEGIKATLTHLGPSVVVVREERNNLVPEEFVEKTLSHPMAVTAMTNPQPGGIGKVTLAPEEPQLKPFEGKGVAGNTKSDSENLLFSLES